MHTCSIGCSPRICCMWSVSSSQKDVQGIMYIHVLIVLSIRMKCNRIQVYWVSSSRIRILFFLFKYVLHGKNCGMLLNKCVLYNLVEGKNLFLPIQIHITLHVAEYCVLYNLLEGKNAQNLTPRPPRLLSVFMPRHLE